MSLCHGCERLFYCIIASGSKSSHLAELTFLRYAKIVKAGHIKKTTYFEVFNFIFNGGPNRTIFEQLLAFSWTDEYIASKELVYRIIKEMNSIDGNVIAVYEAQI